jgi:hypothetical protein
VDIFNKAIVDDGGEYGVTFDFPLDNNNNHAAALEGRGAAHPSPELRVVGEFLEEGQKVRREWKWNAVTNAGRLEDLVKHVLARSVSP